MEIIPIWKDTIYRTEESVFEYSIRVDGRIIYRGRAYKRPNADYNEIKINKICENYLSNNIATLLEIVDDNNGNVPPTNNDEAVKTFQILDKNESILKEYVFLYDWSYDKDMWNEYGTYINLSKPINNKYATGMYKFSTYAEYISIEGTGGISEKWVVMNGISNPIGNTCGKYAIYYLNSYGGWDSFLFEGEVIKEDNISQYTTDRTYNNTEPQFEIQRYVSEIQSSYVCNTGWLSDEQATILTKNLLSSNLCYLHNLESGDIIPVIIDEKSAKYQTYKNNGNLMAQYEIRIKESQTRIRR